MSAFRSAPSSGIGQVVDTRVELEVWWEELTRFRQEEPVGLTDGDLSHSCNVADL